MTAISVHPSNHSTVREYVGLSGGSEVLLVSTVERCSQVQLCCGHW